MGKTILILHGWLVGGQRYSAIQTVFQKKGYKVYSPDLPGYGKEKLTKPVMYLDDYVDFVLRFLAKHKIKKAIIIGHSFGGRIGVKLAAERSDLVEKLIITGAPVIKQPLSPKQKVFALGSKLTKTMLGKIYGKDFLRKLFYKLLGEMDYYK